MKRLILILLIVLLLTGCTAEEPPQTSESATVPSTTEYVDPGLYEPGSAVEQQTGGAVRAYPLEHGNYIWMTAMKNKLLLASDGEQTELTVLSGEKCTISSSGSVAADFTAGNASCQITNMGFCYYSEVTNEVIYLDQQLRQIDKVALPEGAAAKVLVDPKTDEIYYSIQNEIRALDPDTGISRLIRQQSCQSQKLLALYFDGGMLSCHVTDLEGRQSTVYLSTQTGETMSTDQAMYALHTYESNYFALRMDGIVRQQIFGSTQDGITAQNLNVQDQLEPALPLGGVVSWTADETGLNLGFYDLAAGKRTAAVTLPGVGEPVVMTVSGNLLWILVKGEQRQVLYSWDMSLSAVADETVYTGPLYTNASQDEAGLQQCQARVDALNKEHGLAIRILEDAVKEPGDYKLETEYQTAAINRCLDDLEPVLEQFPENFLYKSVNKRIRICIVRSISGDLPGVHYWLEDDSFIVLTPGADIREEFLRAVGYVISTNVLGNSPILDGWTALNPQDFTYGETGGFEQYLAGETMAFADAASMQSITEDRSRLFWYAMKEDNAQMFRSEAMQAKLLLLCQGIRDAWRLERKTDVYPWEQYLKESIAYVKK